MQRMIYLLHVKAAVIAKCGSPSDLTKFAIVLLTLNFQFNALLLELLVVRTMSIITTVAEEFKVASTSQIIHWRQTGNLVVGRFDQKV